MCGYFTMLSTLYIVISHGFYNIILIIKIYVESVLLLSK